ncbi:uncharacterized protein LOC134250801 isoform X3 [Saccostrea cucullata]|uniref:uncharacterized protein LOC134250801 isoform X3 n=1 Tax=Saccostrea cuccullata TaxID=36930 RepID=UPI002ED02DB7
MSICVGANFLIFIAIFIGQIVIFVDVVRMGKEVSSQRNIQGRLELSLAKTLIAVAMTDMFCWIPIGVIEPVFETKLFQNEGSSKSDESHRVSRSSSKKNSNRKTEQEPHNT